MLLRILLRSVRRGDEPIGAIGGIAMHLFCRKPTLQSRTFSGIATEDLPFHHRMAENSSVRLHLPFGILAVALSCAVVPCLAGSVYSTACRPGRFAHHPSTGRASRHQCGKSGSAHEGAGHDAHLGRTHYSLPALSSQERPRRSRHCFKPGLRPHQGLHHRASRKVLTLLDRLLRIHHAVIVSASQQPAQQYI